jgi:hypothetical protein
MADLSVVWLPGRWVVVPLSVAGWVLVKTFLPGGTVGRHGGGHDGVDLGQVGLAEGQVEGAKTLFEVGRGTGAEDGDLDGGVGQHPNDAPLVAVAALRSKALRPVIAEDHPMVLKVWAKRHGCVIQLRTTIVERICKTTPSATPKGWLRGPVSHGERPVPDPRLRNDAVSPPH